MPEQLMEKIAPLALCIGLLNYISAIWKWPLSVHLLFVTCLSGTLVQFETGCNHIDRGYIDRGS